MKLKNILIVVRDIERSKAFYHELFGLTVVTDFGSNVILTEGLVLQEQQSWEELIEKRITYQGYDTILYFEENNMDVFLEKLKKIPYQIEYLHGCMKNYLGKRVIRLYDPDRHVIEISERK